jgi:hypothetical protein
MLDLILAWGSLDGALSILMATIAGENLPDEVDRIGKKKGSMKLLEIMRVIGDGGGRLHRWRSESI